MNLNHSPATNTPLTNTPATNLPATNLPAHSIYLAGGFRSGWQDKLMLAVANNLPDDVPPPAWLDPRRNTNPDPAAYTADVTAALRTATIIVACHEASNPGSALWIELGIAYQRGLPACILFTTPIPHLPVPHLFYFHVSLPGIATTTTYTTTAQWIAHQLTLPPTPPALPPTTQTPTPP